MSRIPETILARRGPDLACILQRIHRDGCTRRIRAQSLYEPTANHASHCDLDGAAAPSAQDDMPSSDYSNHEETGHDEYDYLQQQPWNNETRRRTGLALHVQKIRRWPWWPTTFIAFGVMLLLGLIGGTDKGRLALDEIREYASNASTFSFTNSRDLQKAFKHFLIPASEASADICKLLITSSALSYPAPCLLAWNMTFTEKNQMAQGAHLAKITKTLEYLEHLPAEKDHELVLLVDGYDVWFQLPATVLLYRYYNLLAGADELLGFRFGARAMRNIRNSGLEEDLRNRIIFGAAKRCLPNKPHTMACYMAPESPISENLYDELTDSISSERNFATHRQRYLNAGFAIGPVGAFKKLFREAQAYLDDWETRRIEMDSGQDETALVYGGSDQGVFAAIWGRQEYAREVLRRRIDSHAGKSNDMFKGSIIDGVRVDDRLKPPFKHEPWNTAKDGNVWTMPHQELLNRFDFGITIDYFSSIGHQTLDSERDATWLVRGTSKNSKSSHVQDQISKGMGPRISGDCPIRLSEDLPLDVLLAKVPTVATSAIAGWTDKDDKEKRHAASDTAGPKGSAAPAGLAAEDDDDEDGPDDYTPPPSHGFPYAGEMPDLAIPPTAWQLIPLYTHLCLGTVPALIHHNGDKAARKRDWEHMSWLYAAVKPYLIVTDEYELNGWDPPEDDSNKLDGLNDPYQRKAPGWGGAWTDKGYSMSWPQLCHPHNMLVAEGIFGPAVANDG